MCINYTYRSADAVRFCPFSLDFANQNTTHPHRCLFLISSQGVFPLSLPSLACSLGTCKNLYPEFGYFCKDAL